MTLYILFNVHTHTHTQMSMTTSRLPCLLTLAAFPIALSACAPTSRQSDCLTGLGSGSESRFSECQFMSWCQSELKKLFKVPGSGFTG